MRCRKCGLIFLSRRPTADSISLFYPENYDPYSEPLQVTELHEHRSPLESFLEMIETGWLGKLRKRLMAYLSRRYPDAFIPALQRFYKPPSRGAFLLDFGCGSTWMLNRLRDTRWTTIGMDFMEDLVEQVRREGHRGILVSSEGWAEIEDGLIDAVRMNHVLEHLYEPKAVLSKLMTKMAPGGRIHVAVPNPRGLSAHLFRSKWFGLEAPRHLMIYSPDGLTKLLSDIGFVDIEVVHERTSKDFARSLGYFLRELRLLKPDLVKNMADEPLLNAWIEPLTWFAGGRGYGDRIHAFARKAGASGSDQVAE
jgi:2-polyprenyl-3-methyl-5-hydroxy-6-metoxy-1,4-benzoquinol methylase